MIEIKTQRKIEKLPKETEIKPETVRIAETLGKFTKMRAKNDAGDRSGYYGSRG